MGTVSDSRRALAGRAAVSAFAGRAAVSAFAASVLQTLALRTRRGEARTRALEAVQKQKGAIHSEELLSSFLVRVADVRWHLDAMSLDERERRERTARVHGADEERVLHEPWQDALAEERAGRAMRDPQRPRV